MNEIVPFERYAVRESDQVLAARAEAFLGEDGGRLFDMAHVHRRQFYARDPGIPAALASLAPDHRPEEIGLLYARTEQRLVTFDDAWTALGWRDWWVERRAADPDVEVVILHVDSHEDLKSPYLLNGPSHWIDMFSGRAVAPHEAESIADAVASGAISIGGFIVPWLHVWRRVEVRHLCGHVRGAPKGVVRRPLRKRLVPVQFRGAPAARLSVTADATTTDTVKGDAVELDAATREAGGSVYVGTDRLDAWLDGLPEHAAVLLHIDLDYFSDRISPGPLSRPEPALAEMAHAVERLCRSLTTPHLQGRIEHTSIACSPGFCPSERWAWLLSRLQRGLRGIGGRRTP